MSKKLFQTVPVVLALALVAFVCTSTQAEVKLTDTQLSSVYGGGGSCGGPRDCNYYNSNGCAGPTGNCSGGSEAQCVSPERTTCKQSQYICMSGGWGSCTYQSATCTGTYNYRICEWLVPEAECYQGGWIQRNCSDRTPSTKYSCYES